MNHKWLGIIALLLITSPFTVLAQNEPVTYTSDQIVWHYVSPEKDYAAGAPKPVYFLNVSADEDGHIYVANLWSVVVFDAETGEIETTIADTSGTVVQYDDVAPAGDGNVWVADTKSTNVYLLDPQGSILLSIPSVTPDNNDPEFSPNELEVGPDGNLYVMYSSIEPLIQVFTPEGEFVRSFTTGKPAVAQGLIDFTFGPDGKLYIGGDGASGNGMVRVLDTEGNMIVEQFAQDFLQAGKLSLHGIAVDAEGNVYVSGTSEGDTITGAIYKFDADGQLVGQFGSAQQRVDWGSAFKPGEISFTVALAVLPEGQLVISDSNSTYNQLLLVDTQA